MDVPISLDLGFFFCLVWFGFWFGCIGGWILKMQFPVRPTQPGKTESELGLMVSRQPPIKLVLFVSDLIKGISPMRVAKEQ